MSHQRQAWVLSLLLACWSGAWGDTLRRGAFGEPESLSPNRSGVISELAIVLDLFEGLTTFDAGGRVIPGAAESWQRSEDGLRYTFDLRPNLRWSDGEQLTAEDFVFSLRRALAPATQTTQALRLAAIKNSRAVMRGDKPAEELGVSAPDAMTVTIVLAHPSPRLPLHLAHPEAFPVPKHIIERFGEGWSQPGNLVSNGPFRLVERKPQEYVRLEKNPFHYAASEIKLSGVTYFPSDAVATAVTRFRAGELDLNGWPGFPPRQQAWLQENLPKSVRVSPLLNVAYVRFNVRRRPLADERVRMALALAVDQETLATKVLGGGETAAFNVVPNSVTGYPLATGSPLLRQAMRTRRENALRLLGEAGYSKERPLTLTLRYPSGQGREVAVALQAMWRALPLRLAVENSEIKALIVDLRRGDFDLVLTGALDADDPERFLDRLLPDSSYNTGGFDNPGFAAAMAAAKAAADGAVRAQQLQAAEAVALKSIPVIPLYFGVSRNLVAPHVAGFVDNPADIHLSRYLALNSESDLASE